MTEKDRKVLEVFETVLPRLTDQEKDRLLWIGEGILLKSESQSTSRAS